MSITLSEYDEAISQKLTDIKEKYKEEDVSKVPLKDIMHLEDLECRSCRELLKYKDPNKEEKYVVIFQGHFEYFHTEKDASQYCRRRQSEEYQKGWVSDNPFSCGCYFSLTSDSLLSRNSNFL